tara:strand:+ start:202 stop:552 length:351 start_codon:yes stop_codon:yes gene_type:complete
MAEKKVLTNPNLLNIILSFTGVEIKIKCNVCGTILKYQILNQEIEYDYKSYINFEMCKKEQFCSEDCSYIYKKQYNNERCCLFSTLLCISIGLLTCLVVVLLKNEEPPIININLSV